MTTTTLIDPRMRVSHLIAPIAVGSTLISEARAALEFASRSANKVTIVCLADASFEALDSAMRRLALVVGSGIAGDCAVKLVVRQSDSCDAVQSVLERDPGFVWAPHDAALQQRFDCVS